jgi:surface antigen
MIKRARTAFSCVVLAVALTLSAGGSASAENYWQCVPFARMISGIQLFGDAWTWWQQAAGKYAEGFTPKTGSVLVFKPSGVMSKGHVAVVSQVLTDRIIQVTHANWSVIGGTRGKVERDVTVVDVSPRGDWSQVKVWFDPAGDLGNTVYPTYGFIYQSTGAAARSATENAVRTVAQTAMTQLANAVPGPTANPTSQTQSASDRIAALIASVTGGGEH